MKKFFTGLVLILLIAGCGAPIINGIVMEKYIKNVYRDINTLHTDSGSDVSVEIVKYERNLYSSAIEWKVKLQNMKVAYGVDEVVFTDQVAHGFFGVVSTTSMAKNSWYSDFLTNKLSGKDPLHITTEYKLLGGITSTVALDAFTLESEGKVFDVLSASAITSCDRELKDFSTKALWNGLSLPDELSLGEMTLNSKVEKISTFLWAGNVSFAIKNGWAVENTERIELVNLKNDYSLSFDKKKNLLSVAVSAGADMLKAGSDKIDNAFVRIGVHNMDGTAYEEFMQLYAKTVNSLLEEMAGAGDDPEKLKAIVEQQMTVMGSQAMAAYEKLLKKDLEITVSDLHAKVQSGEINGDFSLRLKKDMTFMQFFPVLGQPALVLDIFSLASSLSLPAELVGEDPMLFAPFYPGMQTGFFEKDDNYLRHKAETKDGKLFLNGKEVLFQ
jgi:uncharacterized protein YdgA (DUF945 family)